MTTEETIAILEDMPTTDEQAEAVSIAKDSLNNIPEGEWEYDGNRYGCMLCGHYEDSPLDRCPNCKAKMTVGAR